MSEEKNLKDDRSISVPFFSEVCSRCENKGEGKARFCRAFPGGTGIPMEIWLGKNNHKKPFTGDMGILFKRRKQ